MALTLEKIVKESGITHKMKLRAGKEGMRNIVEWVHIIEDDEVSTFLKGNELVFITGIGYVNKELLHFIKKLNENGVAGVVVNIGPYIKELPSNVIKYCNDENLPIFTIPWEVRLVDVTREFCKKIVNSEQVEENVVSIFKDIIFQKNNYHKNIPFLERKCFRDDSKYTVLAIYNENIKKNASSDGKLKFYIEKIVNSIKDTVITFSYKTYRIVILCDYEKSEIKLLVDKLIRQYLKNINEKYCIGISSTEYNYSGISDSFDRAIKTVNICVKNNKRIEWYDDLGIYQVLLEAKDTSILVKFYNMVLKTIVQYDEENNTKYEEFINVYIKMNGSTKALSDKLFLHRNTINYQVNKIKKLTGMDLNDLSVRLDFLMAFYIKNMLDL